MEANRYEARSSNSCRQIRKKENMKILLAGGAGFLGRHIYKNFLEVLDAPEISVLDLPGINTLNNVEYLPCDLTDSGHSGSMLKGHSYDVIVHLAGAIRANDRSEFEKVNVTATRNLLMNLDTPPGKVIILSSSAVYGASPEYLWPVREDAPMNPVSEYGRSCMRKEEEALRICNRRGLNMVIVRPFNIIGPGQEPVMMVSEFARDLASAEKYQTQSVIETGPLYTRRDYVDVRDVAGFIVKASVSNRNSTCYNVARGVTRSGNWMLDRLMEQFKLPEHFSIIEKDINSKEISVIDLPGDSSLAYRELGWSAAISTEASLKDVAEYWRTRI